MKFSVEHNDSDGICIVSVHGEHKRPADTILLQNLAQDIRHEKGCVKFIYDMREASITGTISDTFKTGLRPGKEGFERDFRIALVYSEILEDHKFMEDVLVNRGYQVRTFNDIDKAIIWLKPE